MATLFEADTPTHAALVCIARGVPGDAVPDESVTMFVKPVALARMTMAFVPSTNIAPPELTAMPVVIAVTVETVEVVPDTDMIDASHPVPALLR